MRRSRYAFLIPLIHLAIPIALQDLLISGLNLVDTVMIGQLGKEPLSAVSLCNQYYFIMLLFCFGVTSGAAVMMNQFWGARDISGLRRTLSVTLLFVTFGVGIFTLFALGFPRVIMRIFTPDEAVIAYGIDYFRIVALSYPFMGVSIAYQMAARSTQNARLGFYASMASLAINVVLNWVLIFGKLGFPALGVRGAALATVIARIIEMLIILGIIYISRSPVAVRPNVLRQISRKFLWRILVVSLPVAVHEILWAISFSTYKAAFARMGTDTLAANSIVEPLFRLAIVLLIGTANAGAVIIGNRIGAGEPHIAQEQARRMLQLTPLFGLLIGLVLALSAPLTELFYNVEEHIHLLAQQSLRIYILRMPVFAVNLHLVVAILRAGGDNRFNMMLDLSVSYLVAVPIVFITGLVWQWSLPAVHLILIVGDIIIVLLGVWRTLSGRWIHNVIREQ